MTERPWESEPDALDFEAEGLPCSMRRNMNGVWCGYVGVHSDHVLFGLPVNHPLKLPTTWFNGRKGLEGTSPIDLFMHAIMNDKRPFHEACPISIALQVHGGVNYADSWEDERWYFGFDCGHAGDIVPGFADIDRMIGLAGEMPDRLRRFMRVMMDDAVYRDQQYVVGECQSLAAQLVAIVAVLDGEKHEARMQ